MSARPKILFAEDCAPIARANACSLEPAGFDVTIAYNGLEAWEYAQKIQFDLLLTDYDMPGIKGADLCRRLRQDTRYARTPMILMTCYGRDLDLRRLQDELQLSAILGKPFRSSDLLNTIRECMSEEDALLCEALCEIEALSSSVRSTIGRIHPGLRVQVVATGIFQGFEGIVVAVREGGKILVQIESNGVFVEIHRSCVWPIG